MLLFALSGCGQKGDLYLPNIPPAPVVMGVVSGPVVNDEHNNIAEVSKQGTQSQVVSDENLDENEESEIKQSK